MAEREHDDESQYGYPTPGFQKPTVETIMNNLFFLSDTEWENIIKKDNNYDIVVIGSGFCALAVAERALANDPSCRVLIVERGPFFLPHHFQKLGKPFDQTTCGLLETFPWTVSEETAQGLGGPIRYQQGMIPFFGGRSVQWSAWCPEPTREEMHGWPEQIIEVAHYYFPSARKLLHVQKADQIDSNNHPLINLITGRKPVYGVMQSVIQRLLAERATRVHGVYRTEVAPLAVDGRCSGVDFEKYSVPAALLSLASKQARLKDLPNLDIVSNCIVEQIDQDNGVATALKTSRGVLSLGNAKLVLAMGTLPPTTLVRNSFPHIGVAGKRFAAHFISSMVARVPRHDIERVRRFGILELGAFYIAGKGKDYKQQFHIQLTALSNRNPEQNAETALRYMPDVVATASMQQLLSSKDYVIFVCAVLGEMDATNPETWFLQNDDDPDLTTNSKLQIAVNGSDMETWDAMDNATFEILETVLSPRGSERVEYWHGSQEQGKWISERPSETERRVDTLVHESSTLHIGEDDSAPVDTNYLLRGTTNVYMTGGALWPLAGSWNPTLTMVALAQHLADQLVEKKKESLKIIPKGVTKTLETRQSVK